MTQKKWHKLFNDKNFEYNSESKNISLNPYNLAKIIYPGLTKKKFQKITKFIKKSLNISKNDNLLDFGSGNGAFILFFKNKVKNLYSLEISKPLINFQKKNLGKIKYIITNPYNVSFFKKIKNNEIDITISNSVFQYFYSEKYCKLILAEMIRSTKKTIFIYDIKNKNKKNKYLERVRKRQKLSLNDFKKKYKNTPQRFYTKTFFKNFLKKKYPQIKLKFFNLPKEATDYKFGYCLKIIK